MFVTQYQKCGYIQAELIRLQLIPGPEPTLTQVTLVLMRFGSGVKRKCPGHFANEFLTGRKEIPSFLDTNRQKNFRKLELSGSHGSPSCELVHPWQSFLGTCTSSEQRPRHACGMCTHVPQWRTYSHFPESVSPRDRTGLPPEPNMENINHDTVIPRK